MTSTTIISTNVKPFCFLFYSCQQLPYISYNTLIINTFKDNKRRVLFQAMIFETAFQNLVVLIYVVKTDLFCFMRSAFLLYITLISCHNYLNI